MNFWPVVAFVLDTGDELRALWRDATPYFTPEQDTCESCREPHCTEAQRKACTTLAAINPNPRS